MPDSDADASFHPRPDGKIQRADAILQVAQRYFNSSNGIQTRAMMRTLGVALLSDTPLEAGRRLACQRELHHNFNNISVRTFILSGAPIFSMT